MLYDVYENEHQELFYPGADPTRPIAVHIASPLCPLDYYLFARVPAEIISRLDRVTIEIDVDGLHEDHLKLPAGHEAPTPREYPARQPSYRWYCLGKMAICRGNGHLVLHNWPGESTAVDLLLCTWPRFVSSGQADEWLMAQADPAWTSTGVPLGGIGCGRIDICRDGRFRNFSMNENLDAPLEQPDGVPGVYLALTVDGATVDMATRPIITGHAACRTLTYTPRFPQAVLCADQIAPGLHATVTLSGTLCPHDLQRSAIPGFLVHWLIRNEGTAPCRVALHMGWPNLIGAGGGIARKESGIGSGDGVYHHWNDPTDRHETILDEPRWLAIRYTGVPAAQFASSAGEHLLAIRREEGVDVSALASDGQGEVTATVTVPPGGQATAIMCAVTAMPAWIDALGIDRGAYWQNEFVNGREMLGVLLDDAESVLHDAGALAAHLDDSTLPDWLRRRLSNCCYPLVTNSLLYRDGRFSISEAPTEMAGCYGTIDQRLAAHPATHLLFPSLNAMELTLFSNIQHENGGIQHDLGAGHLERAPGEVPWPDLTCSFIIQTAIHAWSTGDEEFAQAMWPRARRALLRHARWAEAGGGVAQVGDELGTSYDCYHYIGTTGYMATLWLATLAISERWAGMMHDENLLPEIAHWRAIARTRLDDDLWNGRFYRAYGNREGVRREACHAGQLAGQVFARLYSGENVLEAARIDACLDSLFALNGNNRFPSPPDEVDANGDAASSIGVLPYIESYLLASAASVADPRVWSLWQRLCTLYEGNGSRPCDTRCMYLPQGTPSWGVYYMTAPASWLVYQALLDFVYTPADGLLRLRATMPGRYPLIHPCFWATAEIGEDGEVTLEVKKTFGDHTYELRELEVPVQIHQVSFERTSLTPATAAGQYRIYSLPAAQPIREGMTWHWQMTACEKSDRCVIAAP
jgi:uncharacterized protein (DUF608 family)